MKFRDDIDLGNTWVVSDTHFGHDNIVGFCFRPEDHEQVIIAEWRAHVPDDATVLHLGDLAYRDNARFKHIIAKELTGERKLLVMGNHDKQRYSFYKSSGFNIVRPFKIDVHIGGDGTLQGIDPTARSSTPRWTISFSHYAWSNEEEGIPMQDNDVRLHGHIHNNGYTRDAYVPFLRNHINLSVEQTKYRPVNLKLLLDGALLGRYPETTQEQLDEARERKAGVRND